MRLYPLLLSFTLLSLLTACGGMTVTLTGDAPEDTFLNERLIAHGVQIYRKNYCGSCHTLTIANTRGTFGPPHDNAGSAARVYITRNTYTGSATSAVGYLYESITDPSVYYTPGYEATNHHMPAFNHLPQADIEALVYLLANQREPFEG